MHSNRRNDQKRLKAALRNEIKKNIEINKMKTVTFEISVTRETYLLLVKHCPTSPKKKFTLKYGPPNYTW